MDKKVLWEAIKEPLRLLVLSIIPVLIVYFTGISQQWAIGAILVLRFIDKWLHELEVAKPKKDQSDTILGVKGLTGF